MKWWAWVLVVILVIMIAVIVGVVGTCAMCFKAVEEAIEEHELTIMEHNLADSYGTPVVVGKARNDTDSSLSFVKIEIKWYSTEGTLIDSSTEYLGTELESKEIWEFSVTGYGVSAKRVGNYKIIATGY